MRVSSSPAVPPEVGVRTVLLSILGFTVGYVALVTIRAAVMNWPDQGGMLARRLGVAIIGGALAYLLHVMLERTRGRPMAQRAVWAFALALPFAASFSTFNFLVFYRWLPVPSAIADAARWGEAALARTAIGEGMVDWYFFFAAWVAFRLALAHAAEARAAERHAASARAEAQEARLAMLRLQVDPHFLYNALNALSSLVTLGETAAARRVIHDLAAFFRAGLTAQPSAEVPLADEIELQRLYLAVEKARFGARLTTKFDIPAELEQVRVPALILQPLVENAVKHGVSRTGKPVTVTVTARREGDALRLVIRDDAGNSDQTLPAPPSTGVGLANVRSRLEARHGPAAVLEAAGGPGGWTSEIVLPVHG